MKITRISGQGGYESKIAMACIVSGLERMARAVLTCGPDSTTASILQMCSSPVPYAIVLNDFNPALVDLEELCSDPRLQRVLCFVEVKRYHEAMPDDKLDDILPLSVASRTAPRLIRASNGIVTSASAVPVELLIAADSEGGEHD